MCTHCQIATWLLEFRPLLNKHGVDVDHHSMWLVKSKGNQPRIAWPGHPEDGMWRETVEATGRKQTESIPVRKATYGVYSIDIDERSPIPHLVIQYHADEDPPHGNMPYTLGVITIALSDLSVRYYRQRCGVATEVRADELPSPMPFTLRR